MALPQELLAHLDEKQEQPLESHLLGTAERAGCYADALGLRTAGRLLGLMHDLGKATEEFQSYLSSFAADAGVEPQVELRGKIDHSTAGALCLFENIPESRRENSPAGIVARLLALCLASHHSGLIDCLKPDGQDGLRERLEATAKREARLNESWSKVSPRLRQQAEILMRDSALLHEFAPSINRLKNAHGDKSVQFGLLVRFLFSCLIDADRTDTADFGQSAAARARANGAYESWEELLFRLEVALGQMERGGEVNRIRAEVSAQCFQAADRERGIYTLTVPTGGGKTLSALRYAIEHARRHNMERIIVVSPYISIVEQNADAARKVLEPEGTQKASVVLEHHSNLVEESLDESSSEAQFRRRVLAENWDARVVFTTSAQVLEALFGKGTRCVRRLHAMARAVVVFDEAQTLPLRLTHLFNNACNFLVSHCQASLLFCTATPPLLDKVDERKGAAHLGHPPELIPDVGGLFARLRRYEVFDHTNQSGGWSLEQAGDLIVEEASKYGSCLAVVNTKQHAHEVFESARRRSGDATVVHLSTAMCPAHRLEKLNLLKSLLPQATPERPVICVSTQLIEAGVDIDFAVVVRDLAGLDSVAQAAGRCNRHGARREGGRVHVIALELPRRALDEIHKGREVARELLGMWRRDHAGEPFPLDDPEQMRRYYEIAFFRRRDEMSFDVAEKKAGRDTTLLEMLGANGAAAEEARRGGWQQTRTMLLQSFCTAAEAFELIPETQGVIVPYGEEGESIVAELSAAFELEWRLLRRAQHFSISLYPERFNRLREAEALYEAQKDSGVYCLRPQYYDKDFGLREEAGQMEALYG
jgi:CRISPR-associated endonuclease/helicase Cas3